MKKDLISERFKVLGDETRLEIIKFLATGEKCVCNIFENFNLTQNLASYHLGILRKLGLIQARKKGKWVYYSLNIKSVENLSEVLDKVLTSKKINTNC